MNSTTSRTREGLAWREFPVFERILGTAGRDPALDRVAGVCRRLHEAAEKSPAGEKARARAALVAFGRTLDLLRHLSSIRDSNSQPGSHDNREGEHA